jgi:hypothetical protein
MTQKFNRDDVVRFADGNGKMLLWGDKVEIDWMQVTGYVEDGRVEVTSYPYTFTFEESALVKVGEIHDVVYDTDPASPNYGNEVYVWLTELNETDEEDESTD